MLDLNLVNVALEPVGSAPEGVLNVPDANSCQYGGWYYNPPSAPVSIELCPNTCQVVSGQTGAGFKVFFGCSTVTQIQ
jgi:hypothetical protein